MFFSNFSRTKKSFYAISWYFFSFGLILGSFSSSLPLIKDEQGLANDFLGIFLMLSVFGSLFSFVFIYFLSSYGSNFILFLTNFFFLFFYPFLGLKALEVEGFVIFLCFYGFFIGLITFSLHSQMLITQKLVKRSYSNYFYLVHALGIIFGAFFSGFLYYSISDLMVFNHNLIISLILLTPGFLFYSWLFTSEEENLLLGSSAKDLTIMYEKLDALDLPFLLSSSNSHRGTRGSNQDSNSRTTYSFSFEALRDPVISLDYTIDSVYSFPSNSSTFGIYKRLTNDEEERDSQTPSPHTLALSEAVAAGPNGLTEQSLNPIHGSTALPATSVGVPSTPISSSKSNSGSTTLLPFTSPSSFPSPYPLPPSPPSPSGSCSPSPSSSSSSRIPSVSPSFFRPSSLENLQDASWKVFDNQKHLDINYLTLGSLIVLSFVSSFSISTVMNWSTLFFEEEFHLNTMLRNFSIMCFYFGIILNILCLKKILHLMNAKRIFQLSLSLSFLGLILITSSSDLNSENEEDHYTVWDVLAVILACFGFILTGFGLSILNPIILVIAETELDGLSIKNCLFILNASSYFGSLLSPIIFGYFSTVFNSLRWSYIFVSAIIFLLLIYITFFLYKLNPIREK